MKEGIRVRACAGRACARSWRAWRAILEEVVRETMK